MATGSFMTPIYSRSQSEVQGDLHNGAQRGANDGIPEELRNIEINVIPHSKIRRRSLRAMPYAADLRNECVFLTNADKIHSFVGILLLTRYHSNTCERHYWSDAEDLRINLVKNAMLRNRFQKLKFYVLFVDNGNTVISNSKVARVVESIPATADSYPKAKAQLQERFGRKIYLCRSM
ncbi:hypothetical protein TNCV_1100281 [Trichonephila clavipes]|nr:hypothetical protein TNCV_1100281 [Trichonephila clavipes]